MATEAYEEEVIKKYGDLSKRFRELTKELRLIVKEHQPSMASLWECRSGLAQSGICHPDAEVMDQIHLGRIEMEWLGVALEEIGLVKGGELTAAGLKARQYYEDTFVASGTVLH